MSKVKYVRTSTEEQNTSRQETNSSNFDKVYIDRCSGATKMGERKEGKKLLKDIEMGAITEVHCSSIDRLGRNLLDVLHMLDLFNKQDVNLFVENIGMYSMIAGKPNSTFKLILTVLSNVAEMEKEFILERQKQGIAIARAKGKYKGRLYGTKISDEKLLEKYKKVVTELKKGESLRRAARLGECSLGTAQRVQKLLTSPNT
ncbi:recombinase family protein [Segetibacter aerophilus]|uniref:Resolvase n=1 Tax=Segetibacter aerophilus TaxID=670293 RepID=A0A512BI41_9BACT|nr:recombinase family protein [Segetibacter aerophilus]GEO11535.1 resolvase [Segetibacter aerophilus]